MFVTGVGETAEIYLIAGSSGSLVEARKVRPTQDPQIRTDSVKHIILSITIK